MSRQPKEPTWPFLCILACLFVLSAAAPRAWERTRRAHDEGLDTPVVEEKLSASEPVEVAAVPEVSPETAVPALAAATTIIEMPEDMILPSISPAVEKVNGLLMVVPHPLIGVGAVDSSVIDLEQFESEIGPSDVELLPAQPVAAELMPAPAMPVPEVSDDRDMSAVSGVRAISPDEIAALVPPVPEADDRLSANADWSVPVALLVELEPLCWQCELGQWAREVSDAVSEASQALAGGSVEADTALAHLKTLYRQGEERAEAARDDGDIDQLRRVLAALERRMTIWDQLAETARSDADRQFTVDWDRLMRNIEQMRTLTEGDSNGLAWNEYLELSTLAGIASEREEGLSPNDRTIARIAILKLDAAGLSGEQRAFLESEAAHHLAESLAEVATEPVDCRIVSECVEAFERTRSPMAGKHLSIEKLKLDLSALPSHHALASSIGDIYQGPNVRIAVAGHLLNRMMPDREPEYQWIRDRVLGHPVQGGSWTSSDIGLSLIPNPERMKAVLTVEGTVEALTSATAGPATFFNDSESSFSAVKQLELTPSGIQFAPVEVEVENRTRLRRIRTNYDGIPLLGSIAHSVARSQHDKNRWAVRREMSHKVQQQTRRQIDDEIDARLGELNDRLKDRLLDPLAAMSLRPEVTDARTTESRMAMQLKLAGPAQLGSHTPRPWAPSDSVLSCQLHQSALNNVIEQLELDGATLTIKEFRDRIGERFNRPEMLDHATEHDDVTITFATCDAVRVDFEDGRIAISLTIARLRAGSRVWRDFRVRAYYRTERTKHSASLTRDGVVELIGRLRTGSQIALRGIFSNTFSKDRVWPIVPVEMSADPRLAGLEITQLTIDDGWVGLAIAPERIQPAMANHGSTGTVK